ncbi:MAG: hypothetical protein ACLQED_13660 [Desulfobaccales bacterium]
MKIRRYADGSTEVDGEWAGDNLVDKLAEEIAALVVRNLAFQEDIRAAKGLLEIWSGKWGDPETFLALKVDTQRWLNFEGDPDWHKNDVRFKPTRLEKELMALTAKGRDQGSGSRGQRKPNP